MTAIYELAALGLPADAQLKDLEEILHGFGVWCAGRQLHQGRFLWAARTAERGLALTQLQFDALIVGLPWARLEEMQRIAYV